MQNPRLAGRYAKSLIDLAMERGQLEIVHKDMLFLQSVCKANREFVVLLRSPVIKADKKIAVIDAVSDGRISELTSAFSHLLINKGREMYLPEIIVAYIEQYKKHKGIYTVRLTTAVPVSEDIKQAIVEKMHSYSSTKKVELESAVKPELIGGFTLEMENTLVDASIAYDLSKIRAQFMNNDFIYKIR